MCDRNKEGKEGQQQMTAELAKFVPVIDGWGGYQGEAEQPEDLEPAEWEAQREVIASRWAITNIVTLVSDPEKEESRPAALHNVVL